MRTRLFRIVLTVTLAVMLSIVLIPFLITQLSPAASRSLQGISLPETTFEDVRFRNKEQDLGLAGMMFWPDGEGPLPAVVIIHGAGTSKRDNPWYLSFVTGLQDDGIAVLLPDKRGSEQSEGDWRTSSFHDLATDTEAAIAFLRANYADEIADIGVLGASQGGQVVPIVATQNDDVAFAINLVGSAMPFYDALVYEENLNLRQMGFLPGVSNVLARASSWHIRNVVQKEFWDKIGNYDPLPYWEQVNVPALIMLGSEDTNTDSATSAANLNALGNPNLRVVMLEGSGHPLEDPVGTGDRYFRHDALAVLRDFIHASTDSAKME
jgi:dipeptidyl aminopeptidase/acylaminoacyl peptidase